MKSYNKIPYHNMGPFGEQCYAFDKLDGSNIRCEWSRKRGWYKFGTRNVMIDERSENFGDVVTLFLDKYGDDLNRIFRKKYPNTDSFIVFSEYYGQNSFAGYHFDEPKDVVLFDVNAYKRGFIPPREFIKEFGELHIPELVYQGPYNDELIINVRNNVWDLKEGVICKGTARVKNGDQVWMTKIKTNDWLTMVKDKYGMKCLLEEFNMDRNLLEEFINS